MKFYDALQLDPSVIKSYMKKAETKQEKNWFLKALLVRDVLLVAFSIVFIGGLSAVFGKENSNLGVVLLCMLLSIRFVDFGCHIRHSLISLGIICLTLLIAPLATQMVHPLIGFVINFSALSFLMVLACDSPEMGNGGLYLFSYIFLSATPISLSAFWLRCGMMLFGYILCGAILFSKHRHKNAETSLHHIVRGFDIHTKKNQYQLQMVLGISLLFLLNGFLHLERFMWAGFACSCMLSPYDPNPKERFVDRIIGVVAGSLIFYAIYVITPDQLLFIYGPLSGLLLGVSAHYRAKTLVTCFGALSMAASIYGIHTAALMRIFNNFVGLIFGFVFFYFFQNILLPFLQKHIPSKSTTISE